MFFQLGHLLKTVVNSCEEFSPDTALFIGNKWENIPEDNKEDVQRDIFEKLSKVYPGIKTRQVHFMSVTDVSKNLCNIFYKRNYAYRNTCIL